MLYWYICKQDIRKCGIYITSFASIPLKPGYAYVVVFSRTVLLSCSQFSYAVPFDRNVSSYFLSQKIIASREGFSLATRYSYSHYRDERFRRDKSNKDLVCLASLCLIQDLCCLIYINNPLVRYWTINVPGTSRFSGTARCFWRERRILRDFELGPVILQSNVVRACSRPD